MRDCPGQVIRILEQKDKNGHNSGGYDKSMSIEDRLIAASFLANCCDAEEFWEHAEALLLRGVTPERFDAERLAT
jgi:hypothetical protein